MRLIPLILVVVLLDGCVPIGGGFLVFDPHTTTRYGPIDGTILDERTHAPIAGAKISFTAYPEMICKSDSSGHFKVNKVLNWKFGYSGNAAGGEDWPRDKDFGWSEIIISHTNYITRNDMYSVLRYDDVVLLKKLDEPSELHPWLIFNSKGEIIKEMGAGQYVKPGDIHITAYVTENNKMLTTPYRMHIGFVQRVYEPKVAPMNDSAGVGYGVLGHNGLDWEFGIVHESLGSHVVDLFRLEFIP